MRIMAAHEMLDLGAGVSGTVDTAGQYVAGDLCDGDPHNPVRTTSTGASFTVTALASMSGINGLVVYNHNLDAGLSCSFSGLGTVVTPTVPPGRIRLNGVALITASGSVGGYNFSVAGNGAVVTIGGLAAGIFREVRTLPPGPSFPHSGYGIANSGEFGGMSKSRGAEARVYGGRVILADAAKAILDDAWRASDNNSLPTIVMPFDTDPMVVTWDSYEPQPLEDDMWGVNVSWREVTRFRWPA